MATSKRPRAKKPKRKSKARQTTLSNFTIPLQPPTTVGGPSPSSVRRSTRTTTDTKNSPAAPLLSIAPDEEPKKKKETKKKPKQQKLQLHKAPAAQAAAPTPPPRQSPSPVPLKTPNFAVVIYTTSKKTTLQQNFQPVQTESWFQPGIPIDPAQDTAAPPPPLLQLPQPSRDKGKGKEIVSQDTGSSNEDNDLVMASARKRKGISTRLAPVDPGGTAEGNRGDGSDGEDDVSTISSKRLTKKNDKQMGAPIVRTEIHIEREDSDEVAVPASKRIRRSKDDKKLQTKLRYDGHESDDDDDPVTPAGRHKTSKIKDEKGGGGNHIKPLEPKEVDGEESEEDLKEDLAFLSSKRHVLPSRTRYNGESPKKKTPFQKKLAELRAKKAGKQIQEDSDSDSSKPKRALYDTDDEEKDGEDQYEDSLFGNYSQADSDSESWIVDDDGSAAIGAPDAEIPLEFTRLSHQSSQTNFKIVCQWVVQSILNPDFPPEDEISNFAIRALDRKIDSYGGSVLQSSIWKAPFMRAMKARPVFETELCDERPTCDACGKSKRPAPHAVSFGGERYDKETLENLEGSDAEGSEDSAGLSIPDPSTVFYLGRNCHARAQMAHAFIHWKKQLRDAIEAILESQGYFSPHWVNRAAKMSTTDRMRWANTVTDNLGDQIKEFYTDLKKGLTDAQNNMTNQRFGTWR